MLMHMMVTRPSTAGRVEASQINDLIILIIIVIRIVKVIRGIRVGVSVNVNTDSAQTKRSIFSNNSMRSLLDFEIYSEK